MKMESTRRVLDVLARLLAGERLTFAAWSQRYEMPGARRTFQRDVAAIRQALAEQALPYQLQATATGFCLVRPLSAAALADLAALGQLIVTAPGVTPLGRQRLLRELAAGLSPQDAAVLTRQLLTVKYGGHRAQVSEEG
ncbi:hypothetical protein [Lacticaseibacillus suihuaensis]